MTTFHASSHVSTQAERAETFYQECSCTVNRFYMHSLSFLLLFSEKPMICKSTQVLNNTFKIYPFEFPKENKLNFSLLDSLNLNVSAEM